MSRPRRNRLISASELARLAYCERQVAFDAAFGRRESPEQKRAQARGELAHADFYREGQRIAKASERRGRCFVATLALGECSDTRALRAFRDLYLRRSMAGRWLIGTYYLCSPSLCRVLAAHPVLLSAVRPPLRAIARLATKFVRIRLGEP